MSCTEILLNFPNMFRSFPWSLKIGFHISMKTSWHVEYLSELNLDRKFCHFGIFVAIFHHPGYCISDPKGLKCQFPPTHPLPKTDYISAKPPDTLTVHNQAKKIKVPGSSMDLVRK